jgi:hypothetical protein
MTVTSQRKVPLKQFKKIPPVTFPDDATTATLPEVSALFGMPEKTFTSLYVHTERLRFDRLHRFNMTDVLRIYDSIPSPKKRYRYEI